MSPSGPDSVTTQKTQSLAHVKTTNHVPRLNRTRLTAVLSSVSALALGPLCAQSALAASVTTCNDSGAGSLRAAVAATASGGTVTFSSSLPACTITLTSGEIPVGVANLTIQGPASNAFTINGGGTSRVFNHSGNGTLSIEHLDIEYGKYSGATAKGGCIVSAGSVNLFATKVHNCVAAGSTVAHGGAIYATNSATLLLSSVTGSTAQSVGGAFGGGIDAASVYAQYSDISDNNAIFPSNSSPTSNATFQGGGTNARTGVTNITNSTITNNSARGAQNDKINTTANGGCVFGNGAIYIAATDISGCAATSYVRTQGGAIFAASSVSLINSTVTNSYGNGTNGSYGGAIRATNAKLSYATVSGNSVSAGPYGFAGNFEGGGLFVYQGSAQIGNSTIDGNVSVGAGGAMFTIHSNITVDNSTISGNAGYGNGSVPAGSGGIQMAGSGATLHISNSTIAFNKGDAGGDPYLGGGVRAVGTAVIESSIISNNTMGGGASDLSCACGTSASKTISGANDLILAIDAGAIAPPAGMVTVTTDPHLVPLGYHGGLTRTHALPPYSSAVGAGNNIANFVYEQRGIGYPRLNGGLADIGAYERQPNDDEIFYSGFQ